MKISLKAARVNANLTQEEVADKLGVSKHTIIHWEKGIIKPKKYVLMVLSQLYGVNINNFKQ